MICRLLNLLYAFRGASDSGHDWSDATYTVSDGREWETWTCSRCGATDRVWRSY